MAKSAIHTLINPQDRAFEASRQVALVVGASLVVALCARVTIPLMPLTPVPLTVQNLGVLLVGMMLGSRRRVQSHRPGRNRPAIRPHRGIPDGVPVRRLPCRLCS